MLCEASCLPLDQLGCPVNLVSSNGHENGIVSVDFKACVWPLVGCHMSILGMSGSCGAGTLNPLVSLRTLGC